jgi:hypothetical protein
LLWNKALSLILGFIRKAKVIKVTEHCDLNLLGIVDDQREDRVLPQASSLRLCDFSNKSISSCTIYSIVACWLVARQRPRDKQIDNNRWW